MSHLLAHLGFATTAGVYVAGDQAYVTHVAHTPLGPRELSQTVHTLDMDSELSLAEQLADLFDEMGVNTVALSLPTHDCYLATRPMAMNATAISPKVLLRESMRSSSAPIEGMLADTCTRKPGKRELVTIAGAPRQMVMELVSIAEDRTWRFMLAEPAPLSLLRQTRQKRKGPCIHVYLGDHEALSILSCDGEVLLWNLARVKHGDEATLVLSQVRALQTVAAGSGIDLTIDRAVVHGRADLRSLVDVQWIELELNLAFAWESDDLAAPTVYSAGAAFGVVEGDESINLARPFVSHAKFREVFPWRELVMYAVMLLVMTGMLRIRHNEVLSQSATLVSANPQVTLSTSEIEKRRTTLQARIANAQKFVDTRVAWTACVRDVTASLPPSVVLTSISGEAPMAARKGKGKGKKKSSKTLVLKGAVTVQSAGLIPHEVDRLLEALRANERLAAEFGNIELADLKQFESGGGDGEFAMFTIVCLPRERGTSKA